jgi:predicted polyphosphate/ATP-dependent NAD kinase
VKQKSRSPAVVGIIPNPASGKDIRRIVAHVLVMSNREKVNLVRCLLIGLHAVGVDNVQIMPDRFGIGQRAIDGLQRNNREIVSGVTLIDMPISGTGRDTILAAQLLRDGRANCIVTLGGDGTVRLAGNNCGEVPILPISTGTNNVLPTFVDGTVAGLGVGYFVQQEQEERLKLSYRAKRLDIEVNGQMIDTALIDIAAIQGGVVGSKAVWEPEDICQLFVTQAAPTNIGLSAIVGMVRPISVHDPFGAVLELNVNDPSQSVIAAIGPGLVSTIPFEGITYLVPGVRYPITDSRPLVLALDGEREIVLHAEDDAAVYLNEDGPWIVSVEPVMKTAVKNEFFTRI